MLKHDWLSSVTVLRTELATFFMEYHFLLQRRTDKLVTYTWVFGIFLRVSRGKAVIHFAANDKS